MIGQMIGITTSIATTAAIGVARAGAAAVTGAGRQAPVRTRTIVRDSRNSVATLIQALDAEKARRAQLEFENARMAEKIAIAEEVIDELMQRVVEKH